MLSEYFFTLDLCVCDITDVVSKKTKKKNNKNKKQCVTTLKHYKLQKSRKRIPM